VEFSVFWTRGGKKNGGQKMSFSKPTGGN